MKGTTLFRAVGSIDPELVEQSDAPVRLLSGRRTVFAVAAAVVLTAALLILPAVFGNRAVRAQETLTSGIPESPSGDQNGDGAGTDESNYYAFYNYGVDSGKYSSYVKGRVIAVVGSSGEAERIGAKIADSSVTACWVDSSGKRISEEEHARAEIYEIKGVPESVAVAILFKDKLEAQTLEHYYVIMNPEADLTPVKAYIITSLNPSEADAGYADESADEITFMS